MAKHNRQEFVRLTQEGKGPVLQLLGELRKETPNQFAAILDGIKDRRAPDDLNAADKADITALHAAFADYVLLLDASAAGIEAMADAAVRPATASTLEAAALP